MRHRKAHAILALLVAPAIACAHLPSDLKAWATDKALRLGECAAGELVTRGDAKRCIGPNYIRDLGTEACEQAHTLLASLPTEAPTGRGEE